MIEKLLRPFLFSFLLFAACSTACAGDAPRLSATCHAETPAATVVLAEGGWSLGKYIAGGGRTRIVQVCAAVMCVALFILMRKLQ
jgi:hypothetical protein